MKRQNPLRAMKRKALREQGLTFKDRLTEAVRRGEAVKPVSFAWDKSKIKKGVPTLEATQ